MKLLTKGGGDKMEKPWLKFYDPGVPGSIDYPSIPLHVLLKRSAEKYPDRAALIYGAPLGGRYMAKKITFRELDALVDRFAAALQKMGVKKGDRVALYLLNTPQYAIAYYGAARAGAIIVPCNPLYVARELEHQINDSGAETLIALTLLYPNVKAVRANTPLKRVIMTNVKEYFPTVLRTLFTLAREKKEGHFLSIEGEKDTYWLQDLLASAPEKPAPVDIAGNDTVCLLYTGGTTGVPKGAELTNRNLLANALQTQHWFKAKEGQETVLTALPLFHSYGMTTCLNFAMAAGASMILIPNPRDVHAIMLAVKNFKPTVFPGVPTMYVAFNNFPEVQSYGVDSIRACISGAAGLPVEVQQKFQELTGGKLVEGYGLSEASPVTHANPIYGQNKIGTIGTPFPDTVAKVMDLETGEKEMPVDEVGELAVSGPQVMKGYWNKPDETAMVLRGEWLYTGDMAKMDTDGYFQIVDRKKDMIISGGYNIYPRDVEEVLYEHPKVQEVVVAGIPDPYRGEMVKAYVVLKQDQTCTEEELIEFCRARLAKYKVPRAVEFRKELPKTMVGKVLRRLLVEEEKKKMQPQ
jgi:long-chain acyl-CoA synthetase